MYPTATTAIIPLFAALAHGYANPGACSGPCNVHDPSLIRRESDGLYFRFSTGNKISYATAESIEGPWTNVGSMLPDGSVINLEGNDDLWVSFSLILFQTIGHQCDRILFPWSLVLRSTGARCPTRKRRISCLL